MLSSKINKEVHGLVTPIIMKPFVNNALGKDMNLTFQEPESKWVAIVLKFPWYLISNVFII